MYKYHCLNPIADIGLNNFTEDYTKIDDCRRCRCASRKKCSYA